MACVPRQQSSCENDWSGLAQKHLCPFGMKLGYARGAVCSELETGERRTLQLEVPRFLSEPACLYESTYRRRREPGQPGQRHVSGLQCFCDRIGPQGQHRWIAHWYHQFEKHFCLHGSSLTAEFERSEERRVGIEVRKLGRP